MSAEPAGTSAAEPAAASHEQLAQAQQEPLEASPPKASRTQLDLDSDAAFPALAAYPRPGPKAAAGAWGAAPKLPLPARSPPHVVASLATQTLILPSSAISLAPSQHAKVQQRRGDHEPTTLGEAIGQTVRALPGVQIEASTGKDSTTFLFKAKTEDLVGRAKKDLLARISRRVRFLWSQLVSLPILVFSRSSSLTLADPLLDADLRDRPSSCFDPSIYYRSQRCASSLSCAWSTIDHSPQKSGRTLKSIVDQTSTQIHVPPRESSEPSSPPLDGATDAAEADDQVIPVTITGPSSSVDVARDLIQAIVTERTSRASVKIGSAEIGREYWPLLRKRQQTLVSEADAAQVDLRIPRWATVDRARPIGDDDAEAEKKERTEPVISVSGEREAVARVVNSLKDKYEGLVRFCPFHFFCLHFAH
jgi:hypothetical protein